MIATATAMGTTTRTMSKKARFSRRRFRASLFGIVPLLVAVLHGIRNDNVDHHHHHQVESFVVFSTPAKKRDGRSSGFGGDNKIRDARGIRSSSTSGDNVGGNGSDRPSLSSSATVPNTEINNSKVGRNNGNDRKSNNKSIGAGGRRFDPLSNNGDSYKGRGQSPPSQSLPISDGVVNNIGSGYNSHNDEKNRSSGTNGKSSEYSAAKVARRASSTSVKVSSRPTATSSSTSPILSDRRRRWSRQQNDPRQNQHQERRHMVESRGSYGPPRRQRRSLREREVQPPFPDGLCGGTLVTIPPSDTYGIDTKLSGNELLLPPRPIQVWLPPGYNPRDGDGSVAGGGTGTGNTNDMRSRRHSNRCRHPVLYVHDGQSAIHDRDSWTGRSWRLAGAITRLAEHNRLHPPASCNGGGNIKMRTTTPASAAAAATKKVAETATWNGYAVSPMPILVLMPSAGAKGFGRKLKDGIDGRDDDDDDENDEMNLFGGIIKRRHLEYGDCTWPTARAHVDFVAETLKPVVDAMFRTVPDAEYNHVIGASLGGQAALNVLLHHPDKFGGAACLSPAFGPGTAALVRKLCRNDGGGFGDVGGGGRTYRPRNALRGKRLYFDMGGDMDDVKVPLFDLLDHVTERHSWNPGYFWLDTQLQWTLDNVRTALSDANIKHRYGTFPGGRHNERAWSLRIHQPLLHLFGD